MTGDADGSLALWRAHLLTAARALEKGVHFPFLPALSHSFSAGQPVSQRQIPIILHIPLIKVSGKNTEISINQQRESQKIGCPVRRRKFPQKHGRDNKDQRRHD